ncbi:MAG: hypothetical protein DRP74_02590 [Candidatus Omnitrophota bacterium]|nr:MAG: hypothetical protein DRP74_02590 [Candidatus Omnitrophota bacterium]
MFMGEKEFAKLLTKQGKKWKYEPRAFPMPEPYARFIPDFYIPEENIYYEVEKNYSVDKQKQYCSFQKRKFKKGG